MINFYADSLKCQCCRINLELLIFWNRVFYDFCQLGCSFDVLILSG